MTPLKIDFSGRLAASHWAGRGLFIIVLGMVGQVVIDYASLNAELENWQAQWRSLTHKRNADHPPPASPTETEKRRAELKSADKVRSRLSTPWGGLFEAVENNTTADVVLLGLEPDLERQEVRITAEARDTMAMLDYLRSLRGEASLSAAHIIGHQMQTQDPQKPVRFQISAEWVSRADNKQRTRELAIDP